MTWSGYECNFEIEMQSICLCYTHLFLPLCRPQGHGGKPTSYGGGKDHVRKSHQEDFQDEDDDKKKSAYNGNSVQQQ